MGSKNYAECEFDEFGLPVRELRAETDFARYLKLLNLFAQKYCIIVASRDTPWGMGFSEGLVSLITDMGFKCNLYKKFRCSYAAVMDSGKIVFEKQESAGSSFVEEEVILNENRIFVRSTGFYSEKAESSIKINGREYSSDAAGLNLIVYDKNSDTVLDSVCLRFKETLSVYRFSDHEKTARAFLSAHPGVSLVSLKGMTFPNDYFDLPDYKFTKNEKFLSETCFGLDYIANNFNKNISALNKYYNGSEIFEVLTPPKAYNDLNGVRRFEDHCGELVNIVGGHRVTAFHPEQKPNDIYIYIYILGGCGTFGVGASDTTTIASFLQKRFNEMAPQYKVIVENYGHFLLNLKNTDDVISGILNSLPVRPGDVVIWEYPIPGFPCIDISKAVYEPRDFEVFFDRWHYTPDGNRLAAERIFDALIKQGIMDKAREKGTHKFDANDTVPLKNDTQRVDERADCEFDEFRLPVKELRTETDFARYLKLLKLFAKKYMVLVNSLDTPVGPGFTLETIKLYIDVGFQAKMFYVVDGTIHMRFRSAYAAVIDAGSLICEEVRENNEYVDLSFGYEGNDIHIQSRGFYTMSGADRGLIEVNGRDQMQKRRGLNFIVYDKRSGLIVDNANFDTFSEAPLGIHCLPRQTQAGFYETVRSQLEEYKRRITELYNTEICSSEALPTVGAVVMNCNPFTLGHRYLIETAARRCDKLIIFVVEEDKSVFPFNDRLKLVEVGTRDISNVKVMPSGKFVLSSLTFSEYFNKSEMQDRVIDTSLDVTVFARDIAPCLGITKRFAGEEPFDNVTRQYNDNMKRILPQYGIEFIEILRKETDGEPISASRVRKLLDEKRFDEIARLVPETTLEYLREKFG